MFLGLLIPVFAIVQDLAHGRPGSRCNLYEVQFTLNGHLSGALNIENTQL